MNNWFCSTTCRWGVCSTWRVMVGHSSTCVLALLWHTTTGLTRCASATTAAGPCAVQRDLPRRPPVHHQQPAEEQGQRQARPRRDPGECVRETVVVVVVVCSSSRQVKAIAMCCKLAVSPELRPWLKRPVTPWPVVTSACGPAVPPVQGAGRVAARPAVAVQGGKSGCRGLPCC